MSIKIGGIDIGKTIINLEYQTELNTRLIKYIIEKSMKKVNYSQEAIDKFKKEAVRAVNDKYERTMLTLKKND